MGWGLEPISVQVPKLCNLSCNKLTFMEYLLRAEDSEKRHSQGLRDSSDRALLNNGTYDGEEGERNNGKEAA